MSLPSESELLRTRKASARPRTRFGPLSPPPKLCCNVSRRTVLQYTTVTIDGVSRASGRAESEQTGGYNEELVGSVTTVAERLCSVRFPPCFSLPGISKRHQKKDRLLTNVCML